MHRLRAALLLGLTKESTGQGALTSEEHPVESQEEHGSGAHLYPGALEEHRRGGGGAGQRKDAKEPTGEDGSPGPEPGDVLTPDENGHDPDYGHDAGREPGRSSELPDDPCESHPDRRHGHGDKGSDDDDEHGGDDLAVVVVERSASGRSRMWEMFPY